MKQTLQILYGWLTNHETKVRSFCAILISFESVVILAEIKTKSAKITALLKEMRIAKLSS